MGSTVIRQWRDRIFLSSVMSMFLPQLFLLASNTSKNLGPEKNLVSAGVARPWVWGTLERRGSCQVCMMKRKS